MQPALLDTDTLSELLKQRNAMVAARGKAYLRSHGQFSFSAFTCYEIRRGCLEKQAVRFLARFEAFCTHSQVLSLSEAILARAADLWVTGRRGGQPHSDADLLIAATALEHNLALITGNSRHFSWIHGLQLDDWRTP
jgi:tRNA(fMet)-specific endonuclease VapC